MAPLRRRLGLGWKVAFWSGALAVVLFLLWLCSAVLLPFVMAAVLGYLLDPLANKLERLGVSRVWSTTIILVGAFVVVVLAMVLFTPMLVRQVAGFAKALPGLVQRAQDLGTQAASAFTQHGWGARLLERFGIDGGGTVSELRTVSGDYANRAVSWAVAFFNGVLSRSAALLDLFSLIIVTPVVAFYMLLDWRKMVATIDSLIPPRNRDTVRAIAHDIDQALAGFLRGQSMVCLFLACWYGIGLTVIGLNFGLLIGIVGGLLSFVPYVGSLLVLVLSLLIAVVQGWPSWHLAAFAFGVVIIGQALEGNVLSPKLVGDRVGLHPVWIMFALLAFGSVWGFTGLVVAVPVASAIGVLLRFATARYRESPIYTGMIPPSEPQVALPPASAEPQQVAG
ncbi:AI-2E family transporter [Beijerinckiaceae bacterium RH AL1]|jgi:predicted PurR-regulated permease PerM|nr:AI-2E family transporter [Beijerinckiaceae bacterium RH CH11]VVB46060.1 AI-2E family transporter [Beijerinckiaceae bacterium RH AL8]VVC55139.1 AI-2E family transporter [Beijerinckiaceae bacterium RH AL1]